MKQDEIDLDAMEADVSRKTDNEQRKRKLDRELDKELENTFPASDALKVTRGRPTESEILEQAGDERGT